MKIFLGILSFIFGLIAIVSMLADNWTAGFIFGGLALGAIFLLPDDKKWHYEGSTHHFRKR